MVLIIKKFSDVWKQSEFETKNDWFYCRKKPVTLKAIELEQDCEVETLEGTMKGKKGDFIIQGVRGEVYVCRRDIFEETYRKVK